MAEAVPGYEASIWLGLMAPAGTPAPVVGKLNALNNECLRGDEVTAALAKLYALPKIGTPADFAAFIASERTKWAEVVRVSGAKID